MPGKYGQASTRAPTRQDRKKGGPREYPHTHTRMGVTEDIERKGKMNYVTRPTSVVSPIKWDTVYLNEK
jgi:hypothetical protein